MPKKGSNMHYAGVSKNACKEIEAVFIFSLQSN